MVLECALVTHPTGLMVFKCSATAVIEGVSAGSADG